MGYFLMKLLGWTLDLQLQKKKPPPTMFTCEYIKTFRASTEKYWMSSVFFDEIQGCVLQVCSFIKTLVHYRIFSQKKTFFIFFKQLVFSIFPKQNLRWILFTAKLQSENVGLQLYWKKLHNRSFPENFPKFCDQLFFLVSPFVVKK